MRISDWSSDVCSSDLGTLKIGERVVNDVPPKDRDIAMVFQSYALYPHMTVAGNLAFGLKLRGHDKASIAARVAEAAQTLELDQLRSEEHTSEIQSLMRISYAVFCLQKKRAIHDSHRDDTHIETR